MPPRLSDVSGEVLDGDEPQQVVYSFTDGHRRRVLMSTTDAAALRDVGKNVTPSLRRLLSRLPVSATAKWLLAAAVAAGIGAWVSDQYSDKQTEIQLEAGLISSVSHDSVELFQNAQEAQRSATAAERSTLGNEAVDAWVLSSADVQGTLEAYYPNSTILDRWGNFQSALYRWGALAIDSNSSETPAEAQARRESDVKLIRKYVESEIGDATRESPVPNPWMELSSNAPVDPATYQWLGFYVLRGRGALLADLRDARPQLD